MRINSPITYTFPQSVTIDRTPDNRPRPQAEVVIAPAPDQSSATPPRAAVPALTRNEINQLNSSNFSSLDTQYDQPSERNLKAIHSYQSIVDTPRREEIQSLVGIDVYA